MTSILVGTPCYDGMVTSEYVASILGLQNLLSKEGVGFSIAMPSASLITVARNVIVSSFLENRNLTHLLFIDADIGFEPRLVQRYLRLEKDIVAGIYPVKRFEEQAFRSLAEREPIGAAFKYAVKLLEGEQPNMEGFARARYAATGFMLIRRSVIEQMIARYPNLKYRHNFVIGVDASNFHYALFDTSLDQKSGVYFPEDYTFCNRWREMGGDIWVDTMSKLTHVGNHAYHGDFSASLNRFR